MIVRPSVASSRGGARRTPTRSRLGVGTLTGTQVKARPEGVTGQALACGDDLDEAELVAMDAEVRSLRRELDHHWRTERERSQA